MSAKDLSELSMFDLFRLEADNQVQVLTAGLLALERDPRQAECLESCMRAAHSLKGAARIVGVDASVSVAHAMEDCFVAAQRGAIELLQPQIDKLLQGVDLLRRIAKTEENELSYWDAEHSHEVKHYVDGLAGVLQGGGELSVKEQDVLLQPASEAADIRLPNAVQTAREGHDPYLRVTAEDLNRLLGLASESLVESRWVQPFARSLLQLKRMHYSLSSALDRLREAAAQGSFDESARDSLMVARSNSLACQQALTQRLAELETFDRRMANLAQRLHTTALSCRMRPFADGVRAFPRMVRDLARSLGKQARLEIIGADTQVDRDILAQLEAPLGHLLRNAVDHGLESTEERVARGKPQEGVVQLKAHHSGGRLRVSVADDGRGVDVIAVRTAVVERKLTDAPTAAKLTDAELLQFLLLPGFTMARAVTEISGRGVGLDVVQDMVRQVRGNIEIGSQLGQGTRFEMQLPLTLSLVRVLLVEIGGEPYAIALAHIARTLKLPRSSIESLQGRQHFALDGERIGLVSAHQVFGCAEPRFDDAELPIVVLGIHEHRYGLVVDRLLTERQVAVQPLDPRFGKVKDIAAAAVMADGSPLLIIDVDDVLRSIEKLVNAGELGRLGLAGEARADLVVRKRVLVVDDSLTVRELERKLLTNSGYDVEVAVDGMDGWNAVRSSSFDLVITDVDMPRLDGIELVRLMKKDPNVQSLPVMIVSYKDRPEDRRRGLEAGADYYLAKGSFHDDTLLQAVTDLIGGAGS